MQVGSLVGGITLTCDPTTTVREAAIQMTENDQGSLVVMAGTRVAGIVTERDVLNAVSSGAELDDLRVSDCMTTEPDTAAPDLEVTEAAQWMVAAGYRHLPIAADGEILGMMSIKDLLWALTETLDG